MNFSSEKSRVISKENKVLFAFGTVPKDGGTFTFYRNMRPALFKLGIDLRCVTVGRQEADLWQAEFADEGCVLLAANEANRKKQARAFTDWCVENEVNLVAGINSVAILSALPHLPEGIRAISRCANAFDHGYQITMSCYQRLSRIVALAPRQIDDLANNYGASRGRIALIPNGTSTERFRVAASRRRGSEKLLRLGFLGRLEHKQKGVLHLPEILRQLSDRNVDFRLSIAGKGVHEPALRRQLNQNGTADRVEFVGALRPEQIAPYFAEIDIYLFPSHFEGSPNALIEAMMAGCVTFAWRLDGITDFLIEEGKTGIMAQTGDCEALADQISVLDRDRTLLQQMSHDTAASARARFSMNRVVSDYVELIRKVMDEPQIAWQPKSWNEFRIDPAFHQPFWRRCIPAGVKKALGRILYMLRMSNRHE